MGGGWVWGLGVKKERKMGGGDAMGSSVPHTAVHRCVGVVMEQSMQMGGLCLATASRYSARGGGRGGKRMQCRHRPWGMKVALKAGCTGGPQALLKHRGQKGACRVGKWKNI